ncbi:MAG: DUF3418 domain-containing protein [Mesorhizobium sp.]
MRSKARRSDMLADDELLIEFFDCRVPESVVNGKTFEDWREKAERSNPELLQLSLADALSRESNLSPEHYPDVLEVNGVELTASYRFEPGADDDGITLQIPLPVLPKLSPDDSYGTISAWRAREGFEALLEELPRALRRELDSPAELAPRLAQRFTAAETQGSFLLTLSRVLHSVSGVRVPAESFRPDAIPHFLRFNFRIVDRDERGHEKILGEGRELAELLQQHVGRARQVVQRAAPVSNWERVGISAWDFGDLPRHVTRTVLGTELTSFLALVDDKNSVAIRLFDTEPLALAAHRQGIRRLLLLLGKIR